MPIKPKNRDRYPADWPEIRERILDRARRRPACQTRWDGSGDPKCFDRKIPILDGEMLAPCPTCQPLALPRCECEGECGRHDHYPAGEFTGYPDEMRRCGAVNTHPHPTTGSKVVLTIAHLDHTPENCVPENLKAMCQACHLAYDAESHAVERYRSSREDLEAAGQLNLEGF